MPKAARWGTMHLDDRQSAGRCSPGRIRAVRWGARDGALRRRTHVYKAGSDAQDCVLIFCGDRLASERRVMWFGIESISDPAGLPLIVLLMSSCVFVLTPVITTIIPDLHGAEADAFASTRPASPMEYRAAIKLAEYRKMKPGREGSFSTTTPAATTASCVR